MIAPPIPGITTIEITADQICALLSAIDTGTLELDNWLADNEETENTARAGVEELKEQYEKLHAMLSRELEQLWDKEGDNGKKRRIDA
jgi:hypothetical protein